MKWFRAQRKDIRWFVEIWDHYPPIWLFGANEEQIFYTRILSWNCRGMGSKWTISYLSEIRDKHKPDFLFLAETKQESEFV